MHQKPELGNFPSRIFPPEAGNLRLFFVWFFHAEIVRGGKFPAQIYPTELFRLYLFIVRNCFDS